MEHYQAYPFAGQDAAGNHVAGILFRPGDVRGVMFHRLGDVRLREGSVNFRSHLGSCIISLNQAV